LDVEYEWLPPLSHKCSFFGHVDTHCPMKPVWVAKKSSSTDAEKEKSLEEDQTPKTSRLGVGDIGNPSAQVPITTLSYMLKGSARMAGVKPAPEPSAPPSSSIGVDGASDAV